MFLNCIRRSFQRKFSPLTRNTIEVKAKGNAMNTSAQTFDGFHLTPGENDGECRFDFFEFTEDMGNHIDGTKLGHMYHVILFKTEENGVEIDDSFEAIFSDPVVYAKTLPEANIFGTFVKKRERTQEWVDVFLKSVREKINFLNDKIEKGEYDE